MTSMDWTLLVWIKAPKVNSKRKKVRKRKKLRLLSFLSEQFFFSNKFNFEHNTLHQHFHIERCRTKTKKFFFWKIFRFFFFNLKSLHGRYSRSAAWWTRSSSWGRSSASSSGSASAGSSVSCCVEAARSVEAERPWLPGNRPRSARSPESFGRRRSGCLRRSKKESFEARKVEHFERSKTEKETEEFERSRKAESFERKRSERWNGSGRRSRIRKPVWSRTSGSGTQNDRRTVLLRPEK